MIFDWLKKLMPRGLYGRAALILVVPIVTIQLVVSITFIQRHFEDVTRQMTENVVLEVGFVVREIDRAGTLAEARARAEELAAPLELGVVVPASGGIQDRLRAYDLSGKVVAETLRARLDGVEAIDLLGRGGVRILVASRHGPVEIGFDRRRVSARNPHQLLVLMLATGLLMTVIAFIFLRNQLRPIRRLARAAQAFGKGASLPYRPVGATEVRAAGSAFLEMRARIERQIEQRTLLLSGVSHDLRTPLTRLKLGLSMLGDDAEVTALRRDVDEMQQMLDTFLDFARSDAEVEVTKPTDPALLAAGIVEDARRAGHPVSLASVEGQGLAALRQHAVRRALDNLIGNAVRYGNRAEVSVTILERSVRFTVEDDGPGIPKDQRDEALRPFTRLDKARNQNRGTGVGLGLAITADIARGHGGSLRLGDSERLGGLKAELVLSR